MEDGIAEDVGYLSRLVLLSGLYQLHEVGIDEHTQSDGHEIGHVAVVSLQSHIGRAQPAHADQCHAASFEPVFSQLQAGLSADQWVSGAMASLFLAVTPLLKEYVSKRGLNFSFIHFFLICVFY